MWSVVATKQLTAASANNICLSQTPGAAGALTLNGTLVTGGVATLDTQRRIGITSAANDSARTFVVYGTMDSGVAITESVTGANVGVATTLQDFKTVTQITTDAATAGAITVGTTAVGSTPWFVPDYHLNPFIVGARVTFVTGSAQASVETTDDSPLMPLPIYQVGWAQTVPVCTAVGYDGLTDLEGTTQQNIEHPTAGIRLTVIAGTGSVKMALRQSGIAG